MKAYLITTGVVFGLLTLAHIWRIVAEEPHLELGNPSANKTCFFRP
jgi:hypothetical protein